MTVSTRPRGVARRDAILEAVITVVAEVGVDGVTHRRVAETAGLPLASTTYWFASREEMLSAALSGAAEQDISRLREGAEALGDMPDVADALLSLMFDAGEDGLRASHTHLLGAYALWLEAARRPALRDIAIAWEETYVEVATSMLARAGSPDPAGHARVIVCAIDGLILQQLVEGSTPEMRATLHTVITSMVSAR